MGKSARLRPKSSPSASSTSTSTTAGAAASVAMRRNRMKRPAAAAGQSCAASSVILSLLVAFALALFTLFVFTLRPGHGSLRKAFQKPSLSGDEAIDREIELSDRHPFELDDSLGIYGYEIIQEFHHDPSAFTQGLACAGNGTLYESTGLYSKSSVREVDLQTGKVRRKHEMKPRDFGEGLTIWKDTLLQVVWKEKRVLIYDRETLAPKGEISHRMQDGWGLTTSDNLIIGSDGTSKLYFMDPETFEEVLVLTVTDGDREVGWLNELEYVNNEIWANIWQGECIARISPRDGKVTGWILLHGLRSRLLAAGTEGMDVLNGIAWDSEEDKIYDKIPAILGLGYQDSFRGFRAPSQEDLRANVAIIEEGERGTGVTFLSRVRCGQNYMRSDFSTKPTTPMVTCKRYKNFATLDAKVFNDINGNTPQRRCIL